MRKLKMEEVREILDQMIEENPSLVKKITDLFCEIGPYELEVLLDSYY